MTYAQRNKAARIRREAAEKAALAAHGGDRVRASIAHHEARLRRAVDARDYGAMRDAESVLRDLRAMVRA